MVFCCIAIVAVAILWFIALWIRQWLSWPRKDKAYPRFEAPPRALSGHGARPVYGHTQLFEDRAGNAALVFDPQQREIQWLPACLSQRTLGSCFAMFVWGRWRVAIKGPQQAQLLMQQPLQESWPWSPPVTLLGKSCLCFLQEENAHDADELKRIVQKPLRYAQVVQYAPQWAEVAEQCLDDVCAGRFRRKRKDPSKKKKSQQQPQQQTQRTMTSTLTRPSSAASLYSSDDEDYYFGFMDNSGGDDGFGREPFAQQDLLCKLKWEALRSYSFDIVDGPLLNMHQWSRGREQQSRGESTQQQGQQQQEEEEENATSSRRRTWGQAKPLPSRERMLLWMERVKRGVDVIKTTFGPEWMYIWIFNEYGRALNARMHLEDVFQKHVRRVVEESGRQSLSSHRKVVVSHKRGRSYKNPTTQPIPLWTLRENVLRSKEDIYGDPSGRDVTENPIRRRLSSLGGVDNNISNLLVEALRPRSLSAPNARALHHNVQPMAPSPELCYSSSSSSSSSSSYYSSSDDEEYPLHEVPSAESRGLTESWEDDNTEANIVKLELAQFELSNNSRPSAQAWRHMMKQKLEQLESSTPTFSSSLPNTEVQLSMDADQVVSSPPLQPETPVSPSQANACRLPSSTYLPPFAPVPPHIHARSMAFRTSEGKVLSTPPHIHARSVTFRTLKGKVVTTRDFLETSKPVAADAAEPPSMVPPALLSPPTKHAQPQAMSLSNTNITPASSIRADNRDQPKQNESKSRPPKPNKGFDSSPPVSFLEKMLQQHDSKGNGLSQSVTMELSLTLWMMLDVGNAWTAMALHLASTNSEACRRVQGELDKLQALHGRHNLFSRDALDSMPYTDALLYEAIRLCPANLGGLKKTVETVEIPSADVQIPKGSHVFFCQPTDNEFNLEKALGKRPERLGKTYPCVELHGFLPLQGLEVPLMVLQSKVFIVTLFLRFTPFSTQKRTFINRLTSTLSIRKPQSGEVGTPIEAPSLDGALMSAASAHSSGTRQRRSNRQQSKGDYENEGDNDNSDISAVVRRLNQSSQEEEEDERHQQTSDSSTRDVEMGNNNAVLVGPEEGEVSHTEAMSVFTKIPFPEPRRVIFLRPR